MYDNDMTAAWYAAAPAPPPASPAPTRSSTSSLSKVTAAAANALRPAAMKASSAGIANLPHHSSSQLSLSSAYSFDKNTAGDDLPIDAHAPEPERPISRNAMARANARDRERQRTRTYSNISSHGSMSLFDYNREQLEQKKRLERAHEDQNYHQQQQQQLAHHSSLWNGELHVPGVEAFQGARSPSPGPMRARHDSSPAAAGAWAPYTPSQDMASMPPPLPPAQAPQYAQQRNMASPYQHQPPPPSPAASFHQPHLSYQQEQKYAMPPPASPVQYAWPAHAPVVAPQYQPQGQGQGQEYHSRSGQSHAAYGTPQQSPHAYAAPYSYDISAPTTPSSVYSQAPCQSPQQSFVPTVQQGHEEIPKYWSPTSYEPVPGVSFPSDIAKSPHRADCPQPVPFASPAPPPHGAPAGHQHTPASAMPPSRSSSQGSSSAGTLRSNASLSSASGTVRRALPQPPAVRTESAPQSTWTANHPSPSYATPANSVRPARSSTILSRHDSVRMAAEEIMARGSPRRRGIIPSNARSPATHANVSRSDGSIHGNSIGAVDSGSERKATPSGGHHTIRGRAESITCLEQEMRAIKLQEDRQSQSQQSQATQPQTRTPLASMPAPPQHADAPSTVIQVPAAKKSYSPRAASPRPMRASPTPAPDVSICSPMQDVLPMRPRSRGPKDERDQRKSMEVPVAPSPAKSPPPDTKPPIPAICFDLSEDQGAPVSSNIPSIAIDNEPLGPQIVIAGDDHASARGPSDAVSPPCVEVHEHCASGNEQAQPSISISQSSTSVAQRSTTTLAEGAIDGQRAPTSPTRRGPGVAAPAAVSASSVGSGASCATCQKWIGGRVVHAMSHTFHPDCFVCDHCGENLEHVAFYEHEGRAYCHFDYHELFSKRCFHCRTPIVDQRYITINDLELVGSGGDGKGGGQSQERCYHDTHFFCANCGDPFLDPKLASNAAGHDPLGDTIEDENGTVRYGGREFVVHKGYPYCEHCHVSLHKPRCKGCRQPIIDEEYLTALRAKWHVGCFCCDACKRPIEDDNFFVRDNVAYDEQCYKVKLRSEL